MRSDVGMWLAAELVLLASCASADDLMYAYTGRHGASAKDQSAADPGPADLGTEEGWIDHGPSDPGTADDAPADSGIPEESWDTTDRGPDPVPDMADGEADVEDVLDAQDTSDIVCVAQDHKGCSGGNVYWYDSCGNEGSVAETCSCGCSDSACTCCPKCLDKTCGDDGCGGTCNCGEGQYCVAQKCLADGDPCGGIKKVGCCLGTVLAVCSSDTGGVLILQECSDTPAKPLCGWDSSVGGYNCGTTAAEHLPYPLDCAKVWQGV